MMRSAGANADPRPTIPALLALATVRLPLTPVLHSWAAGDSVAADDAGLRAPAMQRLPAEYCAALSNLHAERS